MVLHKETIWFRENSTTELTVNHNVDELFEAEEKLKLLCILGFG